MMDDGHMALLAMFCSLCGVLMSPAGRKGRRCPYQLGGEVYLTLISFRNPIKSFRKDHLEFQSPKTGHVKMVNKDNEG